MCFLMIVLALAGQTVPDREMPVVEVHEWGVIVHGGSCADLVTHPGMYATVEPPDEPLVVRAPVVYFYGPPFTGRFTVETPGMFTALHPETAGQGAAWGLTADWVEYDATGDMAYLPMVDGWNAIPWRNPQSLTLRTDRGIIDEFVYYECTVDPAALPVQPGDMGADVRDGFEHLPAALVIPSYAGPTVLPVRLGAVECPMELMRNLVTAPADLLPLLYEWSVDVLDIDEVDAMWSSWREWMSGEGLPDPESGAALLVYVLPEECLADVSTLELTVEEGYPVEYSRFIVVACTVNLRRPVALP